MREPEVYKPPIEAAEKGRRRASSWHSVFMLAVVVMIVGTFLAGYWQPPRWFVMAAIGILAVLTTATVGTMVRAFDALRVAYQSLWTDYADVYAESRKRFWFMMNFTPDTEHVERVLQTAAYVVLTRHREIAALHEKGIPAPEAENPDAQLATLKQDFERKLSGLESLMKSDLERFRSLRDNAKWAGERRFKVRDSWWDYIDPKDLPKKSRRKDASDGLQTLAEARREQNLDVLTDPIGQPAASPVSGPECGCSPYDCPHAALTLIEDANKRPIPVFSFPTQPGEGDDGLPTSAEARHEQGMTVKGITD